MCVYTSIVLGEIKVSIKSLAGPDPVHAAERGEKKISQAKSLIKTFRTITPLLVSLR